MVKRGYTFKKRAPKNKKFIKRRPPARKGVKRAVNNRINNRMVRNARTNIWLGNSPIPDNTICKLKYSTRFQLDPASTGSLATPDASLATYIFRVNSLFDPDYTTANPLASQGKGSPNHQPYGFDQWATFYAEYMVLGAKIDVDFYNQNNNVLKYNEAGVTVPGAMTGSNYTAAHVLQKSNHGVYVGVHLDDDTDGPTNWSQFVEDGKVKYRTLLPDRHTHLTKYYSYKKMAKWTKRNTVTVDGVPIPISNHQANIAKVGGNPQAIRMCTVFCNAISPVANLDIPPIDCMVNIEYLVKFSDRKEFTQS
jgi:hypothetical protein